VELSDILKAMGIEAPFTAEADFSPMVAADSPPEYVGARSHAHAHALNRPLAHAVPRTHDRQLMIGNVFHKAFVEVNEEGTEAAAASTAMVWFGYAVVMPTVEFVFVIYNTLLQCVRSSSAKCSTPLQRNQPTP
jgi:serpin B